MADSIWRPFLTKFNIFCSNCTEMNIRGILRSLITIPRPKMKNSRWRPFSTKLDVFLTNRLKMKCTKSIYKESSDSANCDSEARIEKFKISNWYGSYFTLQLNFFNFIYVVHICRFLVIFQFSNTKSNIMDLLCRLYFLLEMEMFYLVSQTRWRVACVRARTYVLAILWIFIQYWAVSTYYKL